MYQKEKAQVLYFVGCVASFFPLVQKIPQAFVQILDKSDVDFTTLGRRGVVLRISSHSDGDGGEDAETGGAQSGKGSTS